MQKKAESVRLFDTPFSKEYWAQAVSEFKDLRMLLFAALMIALRVALKSLLGLISDSPFMDCARYFIMCFVAIAVYPLLFRLFAGTAKKA